MGQAGRMLSPAHHESEDTSMMPHLGDQAMSPPPLNFYDEGDEEEQEAFQQRLLRAWLNERNAPELLPFQFDLIQDTLELIQNQMDLIEDELSAGTVEMAFLRCLYQMELERIKYILQSYFRTRINKIERFWYTLRSLPVDAQIRLMSRCELEHLKRYKDLLEAAMRESVLEGLPPQLRALPHQEQQQQRDQQPEEKPSTDYSHVVARFLKDVPELLIDPVMQSVEQDVRRGDMYILQYGAVKKLLADNTVELI